MKPSFHDFMTGDVCYQTLEVSSKVFARKTFIKSFFCVIELITCREKWLGIQHTPNEGSTMKAGS